MLKLDMSQETEKKRLQSRALDLGVGFRGEVFEDMVEKRDLYQVTFMIDHLLNYCAYLKQKEGEKNGKEERRSLEGDHHPVGQDRPRHAGGLY